MRMITNKNEWKNMLSKALKPLPAEERRRVLEYYDELFADRIDEGQREADILLSLGDPVDAANKILADYDAYLERDETAAPKEASEKKEEAGMPELRRADERTFETKTDEKSVDPFDGVPAPSDKKKGFSNTSEQLGPVDFDGDVFTADTNKKFSAVRKLKIDVTVPEIIIRRADKFSLKTEHSGDTKFDVDVGGDTLYIRERAKNIGAAFKNFFGFGSGTLKILIELPELDAVKCNAVKNGCRMQGLSVRRVEIDTTGGDISVVGCDTEYISLRATGGDVEIKGGMHDSVSVTSTSGDISAIGLSAKTLTLTNVGGDITVDDVSAKEKTVCRTMGGDIKATTLESDNIECKTVGGDVKLRIVGNESDYSVNVKSVMGKVHAPLGSDGKKSLSVSGVGGSIDVDFIN